MADISVYYPSQTTADKILTKILEKILEQGERALVLVDSEERLSFLNTTLWTYNPNSFLPHGTKEEGQASRQPIWLTLTEENLNEAGVFIGMDGVIPQGDLSAYQRCILIFPQGWEKESPALGEFLRQGKTKGMALTFFRQNPTGAWDSSSQEG
jgi:DNA polymerase-3 subunit chi